LKTTFFNNLQNVGLLLIFEKFCRQRWSPSRLPRAGARAGVRVCGQAGVQAGGRAQAQAGAGRRRQAQAGAGRRRQAQAGAGRPGGACAPRRRQGA